MCSLVASKWAQICANFKPAQVELAVSLLIQLLGFWLPCTVYLGIDLLFPAFSEKHKLQSEKRQPSTSAIIHCITDVAVSNGINAVLHFAVAYLSDYQLTLFNIDPTLPSLFELILHLIFALLARELLFYGAHRALHHPALYARIHKKHHLFTAPMAFSAQYGHPVEHLFANTMPIVLPLVLIRAHVLTFAVFLLTQLIETSSVHSGYDFAMARMHDKHHEKFRVNFGAIGLCDWLLGTDQDGWEKGASQKS